MLRLAVNGCSHWRYGIQNRILQVKSSLMTKREYHILSTKNSIMRSCSLSKVGNNILCDAQIALDHTIFVICFRGSMPPDPPTNSVATHCDLNTGYVILSTGLSPTTRGNSYFNYEKGDAARIYDKERHAMGADVIAGLLHVNCGKQLKNIHVLDAGCGTGNYSKALIDYGVGRITLLDSSAKMMNIAKDKFKDAIDKNIIDAVISTKLPNLPFPDGMFDAVMFNLVLQQIDAHSQNGEFTGLKETLKNAKRILRPQGVMFITTMLPSHFTNSYWFTQLQHSISERMTPYFLPAEQYLSLFSECGFQCVSSLSLLRAHTPTLFVEYLDPEGPLKENFRIGTSMFGNSNNEELLELENKILNLKHKDLLKDYIKQHDRTPELGFVVLFACIPV